MSQATLRVPIKPGYFTIPDDHAAAPEVICTRCEDCGEYFFPQRLVCAKCLSRNTKEARVPARGTLYAYTWVHMPLFGSMKMEHMEGYGVGQIDLPEGPRLQVPLAGKRDDYTIGMPLTGELEGLREENGQEVVIIRFKPAGS
ncbi:MAG: OB-fold domain-containing protein [bacterium]|nr:OB-fold domain-containing protein [bacterium]